MSSTTATTGPSGLILGLAGVAIVGLVFAAMVKGGNTKTEPGSDNEEKIVLNVTFDPPVRRDLPIHVLAHVEDVEVVNELLTHSPATWPLTIPKSARVVMQVSQEQPGLITCSIMQAGKGVQIDSNAREDIGSIRCYMNRLKP